MMRVLLVKTSSMGDVIHTLPALTDAMQALAGIRFDWVVEEGFAQIPRWHPAVAEVIPVAIRRWRKAWFSAAVRHERRAFRQRLASEQYDAVIDAQGLLKSAALITRYASGCKHGMDWRSAREPLASLFYQRRHAISRRQHAVQRSRQLLAQSLGYAVPDQQGDYAIASHFLPQPAMSRETANAPYLVFLHATTRAEKHWLPERWRQLIALVVQHGWQVKLPWGSEAEQQRAQAIAAGFAQAEVLPRLSLEQVAGVLATAALVVSVDTGLSHLAAALDRPNITLYGPTDPGLIGGYGKYQQALVADNKIMSDIQAQQVYHKLLAVMNTETAYVCG